MQRSFSFQGEDDVPEYRDRTHPLLPPTSLNQKRAPRYSDDEQRQPLNSLQYTTPIPQQQQQQQQQQQSRYNQHAQSGHARHDSTSSNSSSDSSFTDSSVSRAPRTANVTNYQRESMGNNAPRRPIAAAAAAGGGGNIGETRPSPVGAYREEDDQWRRGGSSNFMEPDDQHYTSPSPDTYNQYGQGYSVPPVSQINTPLIPENRFTNPSSPPSAYNQPPPPLHHGKIRGSLPPTPLQGYRPGSVPDRPVLNDPVGGHYTDNPYKRYSTTWDPQLSASQVQIDGTAKDAETFVFSDDEEQAAYNNGGYIAAAAAGTGGAAAAGLGAGKSANTPPRSRGGGGALLGGAVGAGMMSEKAPSSEWMQKQAHQRKKSRWIWGIVILVIILAAAGGTAAGVILRNKNKGSSGATTSSAGSTSGGSGLSADEDVKQNGDLNKDSKEIIALMNNPNLKKAFHGMDYTPLNSQYPACIDNPPTQNNITRDVAAMSLLTDKLRLYGTDCNQTEMVLHAIDVLGISMKIWLGVWLDSNATTNSRQLNHLYTLLANYNADRFEGVAVGNEVLFREDLTETQLFRTIADVRANLTALSIDLPVGTSDLGSNWKSTMVPYVDVLMANVHPFFAGVTVETAANWTYTFFQENDVILTAGVTPAPRVMISEVGWPSGGGKDRGSVAGIDEMNLFMEDFLCTENKRKTEYFWFSAFDEPWKVVYNEPGREWEDKWGLMDVNRNLKDGLKIPDCLVT